MAIDIVGIVERKIANYEKRNGKLSPSERTNLKAALEAKLAENWASAAEQCPEVDEADVLGTLE